MFFQDAESATPDGPSSGEPAQLLGAASAVSTLPAVGAGHEVWHLELRAGHRYLLELASGLDDGGQWLFASLMSPDGRLDSRNGLGVGPAAVDRLVFTPAVSGDFVVETFGQGSVPSTWTLAAHEIGRDDHGDRPETATPLPLDTPADGVIDVPGDVDAFEVTLQAGHRYLVDFDASSDIEQDPCNLTLWDPAEQCIEWVDRSLGFVASVDGAYTLRAGAWGGTGTYRVHIGDRLLDDWVDTPDGASLLAVGQPVQGMLETRGDHDVFRIDVPAGQRLEVALTSEGNSLARPWLVMRDAQGEAIDSAWSGHDDNRQVLWVTTSEAQTHYFDVMATNGSDSYRIDTRWTGADDHADDDREATPLGVSLPASGHIDSVRDTDCFAFDLPAGGRYRIDLTVPADSAGVPPRLALTAAHGTEVWSLWQESPVPITSLSFEAIDAGRCSLRVADGDSTSYALRLTALPEDDHADSVARATPVVLGAPTAGRLDPQHDQDCFVFDAVAGQAYDVQVVAVGTEGWTKSQLAAVTAIGWSGIAYQSMGPEGTLQAQGRFVADATGPTTLVFTAEGSRGSHYDITVAPIDLDGLRGYTVRDAGALPIDMASPIGVRIVAGDVGGELRGTDRDDRLVGGAGRDTLRGDAGNDTLIGGGGIDVARYAGGSEEAQLSWSLQGGWTLADRSGAFGSDWLLGVERVQFDDALVLLDVDGGTGRALRMIALTFGAEGLADGRLVRQALAEVDDGASDQALAEWLLGTAEFKLSPAAGSVAALVTTVCGHLDDVGLFASQRDDWTRHVEFDGLMPAAALADANSLENATWLAGLLGAASVPYWLPLGG